MFKFLLHECTYFFSTGALLLPNPSSDGKSTSKEQAEPTDMNLLHPGHNPLKGKPRITEKDLPENIITNMEHNICSFVTYDAEKVDAIDNFECIKLETECLFAKRAKLWGSPPWKDQLDLEENVLRYQHHNLKLDFFTAKYSKYIT